MAEWNRGAKNGQWKGGRSVASNGYVLIRVGVDHHLADVRGYAYEHRVVAEEKIGRRLRPSEEVHHVDGDRQNNDPSNLEIVTSAEHGVEHRAGGKAVRLPGEPNPLVFCECGCGEQFLRYDDANRQRRFTSGHNPPPAPRREAFLAALAEGPRRIREIAEAIDSSRGAVVNLASKLARRGLVRRVAPGVYEGVQRG